MTKAQNTKNVLKFEFGILILFVICYLGFGIYLEAAAQEELPAPFIAVSPDIYYPQDEILYLEGSALPDSTIEINFQKQGAKPLTLTARSDARGEWVLAEKAPLEEGEWQIRARIVRFNGEVSMWSNPRLIKFVATGFVVGGVTFKFTALLLAALLVFGFSLSLAAYFYFRMRKYQSRAQGMRIKELQKELAGQREKLAEVLLSKNKDDARAMVESGFNDLKNTIKQELRHLEAASGGRALTPQEEEHKEHLLGQLEEVEKEIEIKIKSIA